MSEQVQEEQLRQQRRAERMEAMRREKRLQQIRRKKIKRLIRMAGPCMLGIIITGVLLLTINKANIIKFKSDEEAVVMENLLQGELSDDKLIMEELTNHGEDGNKGSEDNLLKEQGNLGETAAVRENGENLFIAGQDNINYNFTSTEETIPIYDEEIISENIILVDEKADTIVAAKGERTRISPASMTKVLTILVAAEHITYEQLEDTFTMTLEITDYGYINDCSYVGFLNDEKIKVRDMFYGTILQSGSDAAVGLATYVAGSHEAFVELMNEKLEELGLGDTSHVTNCVGLYDENHYSTVYDTAIIMKAAIQNEFCREVLSCKTYTTSPTTEHPEGINISNWFIRRIEDKDTGGLVLCAKTGYVMQSKNCAVSYSTYEDGRSYICVTAGSTSSWRCIYDHVDIYNKYAVG